MTDLEMQAREAELSALRYVLNFADSNTRVSTVMKTFTLPDRVSTKERLEGLYADLSVQSFAEMGANCENCGKPVMVGQLVLLWDDAGEMHADCENPWSLKYNRGVQEPEPCVLLGAPMLLVPLSKIAGDPA
ncbi:hypothetical protein OMP43_21690 [Sphingomonas sp. CBMAI 2297]|uniref:hypothetical protein n=1 Tax=Sphingomonas sp. CBMAI 2297 TaxID=2991720 RepID=UPI0024544ABD|nr:hypothetical protein [Sphingomonas sp. CBMAI 2297]MDH4746643.1 hypothetical protein [Sphingomonas sp. CBMAI 2297]